MKLYQFNRLIREKQIDILWNYGVVVGERVDDYNIYVLYGIYSFYVELRYYGNTLVAITGYEEQDLPEIYLPQVPIASIFSM